MKRQFDSEKLLEMLRLAENVLIIPHNDPDPDAIASALALAEIIKRRRSIDVKIAYQGIIGRAENRALVEYLGQPLHPLTSKELKQADAIALIDTQPGAGNHPVPPGMNIAIVIDHHSRQPESTTAAYVDIPQDYGASSSILTEYLQSFGIIPDQKLATALFYGIKTDTRGLSRGASQADINAYLYLQPLIDHESLVNIEYAPVPDSYFKTLVFTLYKLRRYNTVVFAYCGESDYPDMAAEMADFLLRINGVEWVICTSAYKKTLFVSVRTLDEHGGADNLIKKIIGIRGTAGGHGMMGGGQTPIDGDSAWSLSQSLEKKALQILGIPPGLIGEPLIKEDYSRSAGISS